MVELAIFLGEPFRPHLPVIRVVDSPVLGLKGLRLGIVISLVVLEARLREEVLVGLSTLWGEYSDRSLHASSKGSVCGHDDETFDSILLHHALHINDLFGLSGLSLIAMGRNVRHAFAGGIGPPAERVRHCVVPSRNVDHCEIELGQGLVPSTSVGRWS